MLYILYEIGKGPFALEFGFRSWNGTLIDFYDAGERFERNLPPQVF